MTFSSWSRLATLASAALIAGAGVDFCASYHFINQQRLSQAALLFESISTTGGSDLSRFNADFQAVAPGSTVDIFDSQGHQIDGAHIELSQAAVAWAESCAARSQKICSEGNMVAGGLGSRSPDGRFAIVTVPRPLMKGLLVWMLVSSLVACCLLAVGLFCLAEVLFLKPLRSLQESTHAVAMALSSELAHVSPRVGPSSLPKLFGPLLGPCHEIENLVKDLELMIRTLSDTRRQVSERERLHLEWLAYLSHDLGSPLSRVLRCLEELQYSSEFSSEERVRALNAIHIEVAQVAAAIGSISQFAVLESGIERTFAEVDVTSLLEYAVEVFEGEASTKDIELDLRVAPDVGLVRIERTLMRRAIENLVSNSIRHTPKGGLVSVSAERIGSMARIRVTDTGTGIAAEELQRIFEFAFRGTGETRVAKVGSLGLGLALVRRVAEVHNGNVTARNLDPQGAEFAISIPIAAKKELGTERSEHRS